MIMATSVASVPWISRGELFGDVRSRHDRIASIERVEGFGALTFD